MPKAAGAKIIAKDRREKGHERQIKVKTEADMVDNENELLRQKTCKSRKERKQPRIILSQRLNSFEKSQKIKNNVTITGNAYRELIENKERILTLRDDMIEDADNESEESDGIQSLAR